MSKDCRQHYKMATGEGLAETPPRTNNPGFAKGGHVRPKGFNKGAQNASGSHGHSPYPMGKKDNC